MAKYIEMIDKYRIEQGEGDYNPPSYVWVDNTGEIVRCGECKWYEGKWGCSLLDLVNSDMPNWFCAYGEREVQE